MSRTTDFRLSGWVINSNLFVEDDRFSDLIENKGAISFLIYIVMRGLISLTNGYYAELTAALVRQIHRQMGKCSKGQEHIKEIILYFGDIGILDNALLKDNILTSLDIQKEWLQAKQAKRAKLYGCNLEHWLLVDTLPTPTIDKCSNNGDKCSNNGDKCSNNTDKCDTDNIKQDTTLELVKYQQNIYNSKDNTSNNYNKSNGTTACENVNNSETFTREKVLSIIYSKHPRIESLFAQANLAEHALLYAEYFANACNDDRYQSYRGEGADLKLNKDFFIHVLYEASATAMTWLFQECKARKYDIRQSEEWYFRGIIVHQNVKLAKKMQARFQRGQA